MADNGGSVEHIDAQSERLLGNRVDRPVKFRHAVLPCLHMDVIEMMRAGGFQPDRLPDARRAGVKDACGFRPPVLLSAWDREICRRVLHAKNEAVATAAQLRRNIEGKRDAASFVMAQELAVQPHPGAVIDGAEM